MGLLSSKMLWGGFGAHLPTASGPLLALSGSDWAGAVHGELQTPPAPTQHKETLISVISPSSSQHEL